MFRRCPKNREYKVVTGIEVVAVAGYDAPTSVVIALRCAAANSVDT